MRINRIELVNFRSYTKQRFEFGGVVVVIGENGSGKSNLLEAIYLLATGKSFRADLDSEMMRYQEQYLILNYQFLINGQIQNVTITISEGRKKFEVNGVPRRMVDAVGKLKAVMFGPRDMELIEGSPSVRRRYLDFVLMQADKEYRRCLLSYEKGLRQRNKILENIREGLAGRNQLFFWDKLLIKNGEYITQARGKYLNLLNTFEGGYKVVYDKSVISEARLKQYEVEEVAEANTLVGPHRDDFVIEQESGGAGEYKDVSKYGSRGEQRMAVLWLKTGERNHLIVENELPVLLLDDIFSELDHRHREEVEKIIEDQVNRGGQVIMTTADEHLLPKRDWDIIRLG